MIKLANEKKIIGWQNFYRIQIKTKYYGCNTNSIRTTWRTSHPNPKKTFKNPTKKNSLYFRKWNFLALILKKILIFSQKKAFLIISQKKVFPVSRNGTLQFSVQACKIRKSAQRKIVYTSGNKNREKNLIFLTIFLYLRKWNFWVKSLRFFWYFRRELAKTETSLYFLKKKFYLIFFIRIFFIRRNFYVASNKFRFLFFFNNMFIFF